MKSTPSPWFSLASKSKRLILLTLVSLVAVAALLSLAVSANKANRAAKARAEQVTNAKSAINPLVQDKQPNAPAAAVIVATLTDNTAAATKVAPGGTINYTATVTNNGAASPADDASNLNFSAPLDANTTLVGGSVHASPLAFNDTYNWVGNTQLDTVARALPAVTANDVAVNAPAGTDTFSVTAIAGGATALGGVVTLASPSGSFVYTPPVGRPNVGDGATVQDSFTYTITNSADPTLTSTGTVRINLTGRVWYLVAGGVGDGRSNTPSGSPAAMSTAADKSTDFFYIFSNAGSLNGPFSIDAGQQLLGQGVNLIVSAITLFNSAAPTPTTTNTAGNCVSLAGAPGNNTLSGFNIGNCTGGTAIIGANVGTLNVSTMTINTNGGALDLTGVGAPTVSVVLGGTTSTGGTRNVSLVALNGTFTLASGALSGATGNALHMDGGTAGLTFSGTIQNSGGRQVNIINKTGGTVALSGAIGGTGTGIFMNANPGATMNFTGGIALSTGTNAAFTATGPGPAATSGGTINVTQNNTTIVNTLTSTTGTALNVANTTIGASGMTFRSISSNGAATAIILNNTGASGGLTVAGNSSGQCGGNVNTATNPFTVTAPVTADCTGGEIQSTTSHGISLTNTRNVALTRMWIHNTTLSGIDGTTTTNFTFANGFIEKSGINNSDIPTTGVADISNIAFNDISTGVLNLSGVVSITNSTFLKAFYHGIDIYNESGAGGAGTISNLTLTGNAFNSTTNQSPPGVFTSQGSGIRVNMNGSASGAGQVTRATVSGNSITNFPVAQGIQIQGGNAALGPQAVLGEPASGTDIITITNNAIGGSSVSALMGSNPIQTAMTGTGRAKFSITHNGKRPSDNGLITPLRFFKGIGITASGGNFAQVVYIIDQNNIDASENIFNSSGMAVGSQLGVGQTGSITATITNNKIIGMEGNGILAGVSNSDNTANMTIRNNDIGQPQAGIRPGIRVESGSASGNTTLCLDMANNTSFGSGDGGGTGAPGVGVRKQGTVANVNTFGIEGLLPSPATNVQTEAFLSTQNPSSEMGEVNCCQTAGGSKAISISGNNYVSCSSAPIPPPGNEARGVTFGSNSARMLTVRSLTPARFSPIAHLQTWPTLEEVKTGSLNNIAPSLTMSQPVTDPIAATEKPLAHMSSKDGIASVVAKATPKASASEVARIYQSQRPISHHAVRKNAFSQEPNAPTAGENVTLNTITTFPAGGKSITIKYSATVNSPPLVRQVSTQGTVTANGGISVLTDDPEPAGSANPTVTLVDTLMTWNGVTSTDWNTATNWTPPAGGTQYAPGVSNPAVNDVVIPNVGNQPAISSTDIGVYSLNISNGRTLTITNPRVLTIGGSPGGDLTLDGIISGGALNFGTGSHNLNNAGGTGSLSSTNVATVLSGGTVTLNNNLQAGALGVNAGGSMTIATRTLSLNGSGGALVVPGGATFTTTGSTVIFNGTAAQQAAGVAYNNLTINNTIGLNVTGVTLTGNATINGALALTSSDLATGVFTLTQPNTTASTGVSDVVGTVSRTSVSPFALATPLTFGNPNNVLTITAGATRPTAVTVTLAKTAPPNPNGYAAAVLRTYTISKTGGAGFTSTLRLHYLDTELNGNAEALLNLRFERTSDLHWVAAVPSVVDQPNNHVTCAAVSDTMLTTRWTFSSLAPTASDGVVTGRIVDQSGNPVEGAVVRLEGTQNRKFITDANGFYRFDNVATNGFYTVTPSRANYSFTPSVRSFSQIGESTEAAFGATLTTSTLANPLDTPEYFVRQHYVDFLNREPDEAGFNFWSDQIIECGPDQNCFERRRENVSAAFFLSIEFQRTGAVVDGLYRAAYGARPDFAHFLPDTRTVGLDVQVGKDGWEALLATNTEAFVNSFVNRAEFHAAYDNLSNADYVDTLISHTGVSFTAAERDALLSGLGAGSMTRAEALRSIAGNSRFVSAKFNETFVMMEYFGYLRRDADASGFAFWLNKLNQFNGNFEQAEMVKAFIVSGEYRDRFPR
jgi:hypothetical protein